MLSARPYTSIAILLATFTAGCEPQLSETSDVTDEASNRVFPNGVFVSVLDGDNPVTTQISFSDQPKFIGEGSLHESETKAGRDQSMTWDLFEYADLHQLERRDDQRSTDWYEAQISSWVRSDCEIHLHAMWPSGSVDGVIGTWTSSETSVIGGYVYTSLSSTTKQLELFADGSATLTSTTVWTYQFDFEEPTGEETVDIRELTWNAVLGLAVDDAGATYSIRLLEGALLFEGAEDTLNYAIGSRHGFVAVDDPRCPD